MAQMFVSVDIRKDKKHGLENHGTWEEKRNLDEQLACENMDVMDRKQSAVSLYMYYALFFIYYINRLNTIKNFDFLFNSNLCLKDKKENLSVVSVTFYYRNITNESAFSFYSCM